MFNRLAVIVTVVDTPGTVVEVTNETERLPATNEIVDGTGSNSGFDELNCTVAPVLGASPSSETVTLVA